MVEQLLADEESLFIVCAAIVGVVAILVFGLGNMVVTIVKTKATFQLKQQMLQRGMAPFEIEQVLKAGSGEFKNKWNETGKSPKRETKSAVTPSKVPV